jgi:hypothetical protein
MTVSLRAPTKAERAAESTWAAAAAGSLVAATVALPIESATADATCGAVFCRVAYWAFPTICDA